MGETRKSTKKQEIIAYKLSKTEKRENKKAEIEVNQFRQGGIYKFSAIIFAVDFRFSLCYTKNNRKGKKFFGENSIGT